MAELRAKVQERTREGIYTGALDGNLAAHFRRLASAHEPRDLAPLWDKLRRLEDIGGLELGGVDLGSRLPGGPALHQTANRLLNRYIDNLRSVVSKVADLADAVADVAAELVEVVSDPMSHAHPELVGEVEAVVERLAEYESLPAGSPGGVAELGRRVAALEAAESRRQFHPWFSNQRFEEEFRGAREELLERYRSLAGWFRGGPGTGPVLDIGCGRGELLEVMAELGIDARGVEMDEVLAAGCRSRGLHVSAGDGLADLARSEDGSLAGLVLVQVVEHLSPQQVLDLVLLAYDKVAPGGRVVVETVNPQSLYVYAHSFYLDPTHARPVHPAYLAFLFKEAGFSEVSIDWSSPPPATDMVLPPEAAPGNEREASNVDRLNRLLFAPQDYAVVATRPATEPS